MARAGLSHTEHIVRIRPTGGKNDRAALPKTKSCCLSPFIFAIGCRLSLSTSASVRCDIPIRAATFPPLKLALVLPRVSKRLTMGRSAEGEIKHACRLVSLRSEAAGVSSLGCISAALEVNRSRTARWSRKRALKRIFVSIKTKVNLWPTLRTNAENASGKFYCDDQC